MGSTKTFAQTLQDALNDANPNILASVFKLMKLGDMFSPVKVTVTGMTGAATYDITNPATFVGATVTVVGLPSSTSAEDPIFPNALVELPAIRSVTSLRVTAATTANSVGTYAMTDVAGTVLSPTASSVVGLARISDDGKTLTFATADVTAFILEYQPRSAVDFQAAFAPFTGQ